MLRDFYGAKIDATRRSGLSARDMSAAIRALLDERGVAIAAIVRRRRGLAASARNRRALIRAFEREAARGERDGDWRPPGPAAV